MSNEKMITKRTLGRTKIEASVLGVGGHTYDIGPGKFCTHDERASLVRTLADNGVNYFDTTWMHEVDLLADTFSRTGLDKDLAAGKVHVSLQHVDGMSDDAWASKLRHELEYRLNKMGMKQAELFLMGTGNHKPNTKRMVDCITGMAKLREEGLIKYVGVSCHEFDDYAPLAEAIEETDQIDYLMLRYNFKYRQMEDRLLPVAKEKNIGIVAMLTFCWDCGPGQWGRRISVFEPLEKDEVSTPAGKFLPAQENLRWILKNKNVATMVPAINAPWEAKQNLAAVRDMTSPVDESVFAPFMDRMWSRSQLQDLASSAHSAPIRERARLLLAETTLKA